jgi:hypothetical protein
MVGDWLRYMSMGKKGRKCMRQDVRCAPEKRAPSPAAADRPCSVCFVPSFYPSQRPVLGIPQPVNLYQCHFCGRCQGDKRKQIEAGSSRQTNIPISPTTTCNAPGYCVHASRRYPHRRILHYSANARDSFLECRVDL